MVTTVESILDPNLHNLPEECDKRTCIDAITKIDGEISRLENWKSDLENKKNASLTRFVIEGIDSDLETLASLKNEWKGKLEVAPVN